MKIPIIILVLTSICILTSCEKHYSISGSHEDDLNFPENNNSIEETIILSDYIESENAIIFDFAFDSNNTLWIITQYGLLKISGKSHAVFNSSNSIFNETYPKSITVDKNNNIWINSNNNVYRFNQSQNKWTLFNEQNGDFSTNSFSKILCDSDGRLYIANNCGVCELLNETWQEIINFQEIAGDDSNNMGNRYSKPIIAKQDNSLWISTYFGVIKYKNDTCFEILNTDNSELYDNFTTGIYTDNENRIWISNKGGVQLIDGDNWEYYSNQINFSISGNYIISAANSKPYIKTYHNGLWQNLFDGYFFRIYSYNNAVTDNDGNLWLNDYQKLYKIKPEVLQ